MPLTREPSENRAEERGYKLVIGWRLTDNMLVDCIGKMGKIPSGYDDAYIGK